MDQADIKLLWEFIRGDLATKDFEVWLYNHPKLEQEVGADFYLELISINYRSGGAVAYIQDKLKEYLHKISSLECDCITWSDLTAIDIGSDEFFKIRDSFVTIKSFHMRSLVQCPQCKLYWLESTDNAWYDNIYLNRLSDKEAQSIINDDEWPECFETFEDLIKIGNKFSSWSEGMRADRYTLHWVIGEVAQNRPYITHLEIASLLRINNRYALKLCKEAIVQYNVYIKLPQEDLKTKFLDFFRIYVAMKFYQVKCLFRRTVINYRNSK